MTLNQFILTEMLDAWMIGTPESDSSAGYIAIVTKLFVTLSPRTYVERENPSDKFGWR